MGNRPAHKIRINSERFKRVIRQKGYTIIALGEVSEIDRDEKTIRRYLQLGEMPDELLNRICKVMDVDPVYVTQDFEDQQSWLEPNEEKRAALVDKMKESSYTYFNKEKREALKADYVRTLLTLHDLPESAYEKLGRAGQIRFLLDLDRAIDNVIWTHFSHTDQIGYSPDPKIFRIITHEDGTETIDDEPITDP